MPSSQIGGIQFRGLEGNFPGQGEKSTVKQRPGFDGQLIHRHGRRGDGTEVSGRYHDATAAGRLAVENAAKLLQGTTITGWDNDGLASGAMYVMDVQRGERVENLSDSENEVWQTDIIWKLLKV